MWALPYQRAVCRKPLRLLNHDITNQEAALVRSCDRREGNMAVVRAHCSFEGNTRQKRIKRNFTRK